MLHLSSLSRASTHPYTLSLGSRDITRAPVQLMGKRVNETANSNLAQLYLYYLDFKKLIKNKFSLMSTVVFFSIVLYNILHKWDTICFIEFTECFYSLWGFCWSILVLFRGVNLHCINAYKKTKLTIACFVKCTSFSFLKPFSYVRFYFYHLTFQK